MSSPLQHAVDACPLFKGLSDAEKGELLPLLEVHTFAAGADVVVEGSSHAELWVVVQGRCHVVKCRQNEKVLAVLEPPAVFGEMSFFHPAPTSATVRAVEPLTVARLTREKLDGLLKTSVDIGFVLSLNTVAILADRLRRMDDWACQFLGGGDRPEHHEEWADFQKRLYSDWKF